MAALYLFRALEKFAEFSFTFHTTHPSALQHSCIRKFSAIVCGEITHVLANQTIALQAQAQARDLPRLVLGPNVLFNTPNGDLDHVAENRASVDRERAISDGPFDLLLFPSFWNESAETLNRRLVSRPIAAFPCGLELPPPELLRHEPAHDFLILGKGDYSSKETREPSTTMSAALETRLGREYRVTVLHDYAPAELWPTVARHKLVLYTGASETQGLARLEAASLRATVVSALLPYRTRELAGLQVAFTAEAFAHAAVAALPRWRELAALSNAWIARDFSLRRMYENYVRLLFPRARAA